MRYPHRVSLIALLLFSPTILADDGPAATKEAVCRRAKTPPVIDGKLDDPAWADAAVIDRFPAYWQKQASGTGTKARLLWDDENLYFSATMTDTELRSFGTKRNDTLWLGDVFELFFKPSDDKPAYYEFQVNPKSVILELAFPKRGTDFKILAAKPPMGMQAVAIADGTVDQPGDKDKSWTVEGKIPWTVFAPTGGRPKAGDVWRFALCRYDYGPAGTKEVLMSSAPLTQPSFHRYEDYGRLTFEGSKTSVSQAPPRHLRLRTVDGVRVVDVVDRAIIKEELARELGEEIDGLVEKDGHTKLLVNLSKVVYLSSPALGELVHFKKKAVAVNGQVKLCCLDRDIKELFRITRLVEFFEIYDDEPTALKKF
jgi:anti-anti-sigma factor